MGVKVDVFQAGKNQNGFVKVKVQFQWYDMTDSKKPVKVGKPLLEIFDPESVDTPEKIQAKIDEITPTFEFMLGLTGPDLKHLEDFMALKPVKEGASPAAPASPVGG